MKQAIAALVGIVAVAACGQAPPPAAPPAAVSGMAFVLTRTGQDDALLPVDLASGRVGSRLPVGVLTRDGNRLYTVTGSRLRVLEPTSGAMLLSTPMAPAMGFPTISGAAPGRLSQDGSHLVLESAGWRTGAARLWIGDLRSGTGRTFDLTGRYEFDGISNDGSALFLLQWLPDQPGRYSVRQFDTARGALLPYTLTDKTEPEESMYGERLASVDDPHGDWQYTLYRGGPTGAFIHALQLTGGFPVAWCLDLPQTDAADATAWSIAMARDGSRLYAYSSRQGRLVVVHPSKSGERPVLDPARTVGAPASGRPQSSQGAVSADGSRLFAPSGGAVDVIDTASQRLVRRVDLGTAPVAVTTTRDGAGVLSLTADGTLFEIDAKSLATRSLAAGLGPALGIQGVR